MGRLSTTLTICAVALGAAVVGARRADAQPRQSTLAVGVADAASGAPIAGAEVLLPELRLITRTDSLGQARLAGVPVGVHRVRVRRLGFAPSDVQLRFEGDTTGAVFRLETAATRLSSVDVSADAVPLRLRDFEVRRKQGIGRFLTETDLARDADRPFVDVASFRFPGLTLGTDREGRPHLASTRSSCGGSSQGASGGARMGAGRGVDRIGRRPASGATGGAGEASGASAGGGATMSGSCASTRPCFVQVYLDDINLGEQDDGLIRTWDLSGAEYYTGASMPARYRLSGSACGVLLLWSKWQ